MVFETLSDFTKYQELLPQHFPSVRIRSRRNDTAIVEEHMNLGNIELIIMAKHVSAKPHIHEIFFIGGDAKGSYIREEFVAEELGTKLQVNIDLKFNLKTRLHFLFSKETARNNYENILNDFIKIAG